MNESTAGKTMKMDEDRCDGSLVERKRMREGHEWDWQLNLARGGNGFWGDRFWYDLHMPHRLPLVPKMMEELVLAMPPCDGRERIGDFCCGTGNVAVEIQRAYPETNLVLIDQDEGRLKVAKQRLERAKQFTIDSVGQDPACVGKIQTISHSVDLYNVGESSTLPGAPFDVVVAGLALHCIVRPPKHYCKNRKGKEGSISVNDERDGGSQTTSVGKGHSSMTRRCNATLSSDNNEELPIETGYRRVLKLIFGSLSPGGHLLIADHTGRLPLFQQLKLMESVGFEGVECSWRQNEFFVCGGIKPMPTARSDTGP